MNQRRYSGVGRHLEVGVEVDEEFARIDSVTASRNSALDYDFIDLFVGTGSKHPFEYWLNSATKSSLYAYGSRAVVKIYLQMDQSVLLYGGIAAIATLVFLALSVSTKSLSCGVS
jgi:hypothetical protein